MRYRLLIMLVLLLALLPSGAAPAPMPAASRAIVTPASPPSFGLNSHLGTRYPDPSGMDLPAAMVQDLGVTWVREDFHWHRVQPRPDVWEWTFSDAAVQALSDRGINILGVLGPSVGWATPFPNDPRNDVSYYAPDPERFVAYARGVVSRYRHLIRHWEIWNEPDHDIFWRPKPDPQAYAQLLIRTSAVIKELDPGATVVIGGTNPFDTTFLRAVAEAGAWGSFDVLAIHPYVDPYGPEEGNLLAAADAVRGLAARYGSRPIWVTELGWASGPGERDPRGLTDTQAQASYLVRAMLTLWQAGVERIFWYTFKDDPGNPYGLIASGKGYTDYTVHKPAYYALRTLNAAVAGTRFVARYDLFETRLLTDFERVEGWLRTRQPNGSLNSERGQVHAGRGSARIEYNFTTSSNDYVAFEREIPIPLPGTPHSVGLWVYGDGSGHRLKLWLRDSEGETLQFVLGPAGWAGWHFLSTPLGGQVEPGNRIAGQGNGRLDFPVDLAAIIVDDMTDASTGSGTIYIDDLVVLSGVEAYDLRLERDGESLDILWSPPGLKVLLATTAPQALLTTRDGLVSTIFPRDGQLWLDIGPEPIYVRHAKP